MELARTPQFGVRLSIGRMALRAGIVRAGKQQEPRSQCPRPRGSHYSRSPTRQNGQHSCISLSDRPIRNSRSLPSRRFFAQENRCVSTRRAVVNVNLSHGSVREFSLERRSGISLCRRRDSERKLHSVNCLVAPLAAHFWPARLFPIPCNSLAADPTDVASESINKYPPISLFRSLGGSG
jgi:hypothetical protein